MEQEYLLKAHMSPEKMKYDEYSFSKNTYPWECMDGCNNMKYENMNYKAQYMPIEHMSSSLYVYIYQTVLMSLNKHLPNKSEMPKAISKDNFKIIVNDSMCSLTKNEKQIKDMMKSRCISEFDETDNTRIFCPYCNGMLKSVVEIALITSLLNGGCAFCF